jgi:DNA end-binding protein Ku
MARAIWKGSISFGLVEIPVSVLPAETPNDLKLVYLDRRDLAPVGYQRINKTTGEEVAWADVVRGYEHEPGEYVVLSEGDLERANPKATKTIEILHFVDEDEIEPVYYDKPYYLEPALATSKGYVLLRETLERTRKLAICKVVLHTREHLAALGVRDHVLVLNLLRFPYEVRKPGEVDIPKEGLKQAGVSAREVAMAEELVEGMTEKFDPKKYKDTYREDLLDLVEEKIESGQSHTITEEPAEEGDEQDEGEGGQVHDLMPLLKQSLEGRTRHRAAPRRKKTAARKSRSPKPKKESA